uniref:Uncharacterized protein n=1 Tax=Octopus bimaculoides TaxID=37653 RepID=A0A0L8HJ57_OCTBM
MQVSLSNSREKEDMQLTAMKINTKFHTGLVFLFTFFLFLFVYLFLFIFLFLYFLFVFWFQYSSFDIYLIFIPAQVSIFMVLTIHFMKPAKM